MFPYLGSLITEDGECTMEFRTRLAAWRNGNGVGRINEVTLRRARLVT